MFVLRCRPVGWGRLTGVFRIGLYGLYHMKEHKKCFILCFIRVTSSALKWPQIRFFDQNFFRSKFSTKIWLDSSVLFADSERAAKILSNDMKKSMRKRVENSIRVSGQWTVRLKKMKNDINYWDIHIFSSEIFYLF